MTIAAKITYTLALLIGFTTGAIFGFSWTSAPLERSNSITPTLPPFAFDNFAFMQYKYSDLEHARAALQSYANFLEECEKTYPDLTRGYLAHNYVRMALLEDTANNPEQSRILMTKARLSSHPNGGPEHSDSEMKKAVEMLDERVYR